MKLTKGVVKRNATKSKLSRMPELQKILHTFSGEDGGEKFVKLCSLVNEMSDRESNGDKAASGVLDVVRRFSRLIDVAAPTKP